ncbi:MAG: adenylyltransferase/cytidyltransferase family protein [Alphaproteobacteria bacterium]|nr:adenylyltransferase/cytidyltransferase family protein [Alphaproteobacteria bacterium]
MNIVYSYYVLDIIHRGHLLMMKNSKAIAGENGRLIVGIVSDEAVIKQKGKPPILSFSERLELAQSIKYADLVVAQKDYSPFPNVRQIKPTILMESESHDEAQINEGRELMESLGGKVIVMPYFHSQSSTRIKQQITDEPKTTG